MVNPVNIILKFSKLFDFKYLKVSYTEHILRFPHPHIVKVSELTGYPPYIIMSLISHFWKQLFANKKILTSKFSSLRMVPDLLICECDINSTGASL